MSKYIPTIPIRDIPDVTFIPMIHDYQTGRWEKDRLKLIELKTIK